MRFSWKTERFFVMSDVSQKVAQILLQTEAIQVYREKPFVFVSGRISPVYIDCRKLLSLADEREYILTQLSKKAENDVRLNNIYVVPDGETQCLPYDYSVS